MSEVDAGWNSQSHIPVLAGMTREGEMRGRQVDQQAAGVCGVQTAASGTAQQLDRTQRADYS